MTTPPTRGPLTGAELRDVLDPESDILDEVQSTDQGAIVWAMATEIEMHRSAMTPSMLRAARLYTDEMGALRKRVAELEELVRAGRDEAPNLWASLSDGQRLELMARCCSSCGAMDPRCQCGNDE